MLKNIPKILSPELLKILSAMGHGDEVVIADANFPSETFSKRLVRADGISGVEMLDAVMSVIPLDTYVSANFMLMQTEAGDPIPEIWDEYRKTATNNDKNVREERLNRIDFYARAKNAYAVIATGEERIYANVILKKGVIQ